jgi:hypothetical protein
MSNKIQKMFFVASTMFLLALAASGQLQQNFKLVARHHVVFQGRKFTSSTSPQVNKAENTLTFSGSQIPILALAGPEDAMFSYRVAGLTNPTLRVPTGARLRLTVVNVDDDMSYDLVISSPHASFPQRPEVPLQAVRTPRLAARHGETFQGEVLMIQVLRPGSYDYFCSVPGHPKGGMHGRLEVSRDSRMESASRRLTNQGGTHE